MRKSLSPTESSVRRWDRTSCRKHGTISIKHDERSILVSKPSKRCQRNRSVRPDDNEASQTVPDAGKPSLATMRPYTIFQNQVASIHACGYSISKERYNSMPRSNWSRNCRSANIAVGSA